MIIFTLGDVCYIRKNLKYVFFLTDFSRTNSSLLQFEKSTCLPHSRKLTKHDDVNDVIDYKYFLNIIKTLEKLPKDVENLSLYLPRGWFYFLLCSLLKFLNI